MKTCLTSEEKKLYMEEVQRRLRSDEAKKARALLSMAMSNYQAFNLVKGNIEQKVLEINGFHGPKSKS